MHCLNCDIFQENLVLKQSKYTTRQMFVKNSWIYLLYWHFHHNLTGCFRPTAKFETSWTIFSFTTYHHSAYQTPLKAVLSRLNLLFIPLPNSPPIISQISSPLLVPASQLFICLGHMTILKVNNTPGFNQTDSNWLMTNGCLPTFPVLNRLLITHKTMLTNLTNWLITLRQCKANEKRPISQDNMSVQHHKITTQILMITS